MADNEADEGELKQSKQCENQINVLQEGYGYTDSEQKYRATGSITLVRTKMHVILVDTGSPRDKEKLLETMSKLDVKLDDVDYVICTHGHVDHVGNLNLFPKAVYIVGNDICCKDDMYIENTLQNGDHFLLEAGAIDIIPTPGHTGEDITVIVYNTSYGTVAIAGDLFECKNDEDLWRDVSQCVSKQQINRDNIRQLADWIIPGHGAMFETKQ